MRAPNLDLDLDVYNGPFDLLFTLILKEEIDIFEIPLLEVIVHYVEELADGDDVNWEELTEFLVLISALLEMKSRALLPGAGMEELEIGEEDARELLVEKLARYQQFRRASEWLTRSAATEEGRLLRPAEVPEPHELPSLEDLRATEEPQVLRDSLAALIEARRPPETEHLTNARVSLDRQIVEIRRRVRAAMGGFSFNEAFGAEDAVVQAVTLFGLLDLLSRREVEVEQRHVFGDMKVYSRLGVAVEERSTPSNPLAT